MDGKNRLLRRGILLLVGATILPAWVSAATAASPAAQPPRMHRPEADALELARQVRYWAKPTRAAFS